MDAPIDWSALQQSVDSQTSTYFNRLSPPAPPPPPPPTSYTTTLRIRQPLNDSVIDSNLNQTLNNINENQLNITKELMEMKNSHHSSSLSSSKENASQISSMNTEIISLQKRLRELELELQLNSQRSTLSTQTLEHVNAQTSKHQLWISHADNVIAETSTQLKITNQNMMVLNGNVQGCVSRSEVDGKFSVFKGQNKSVISEMHRSIDDRVNESDKAQEIIATELKGVREKVERGLGYDKGVLRLEESELGGEIMKKVERIIEERVEKALGSVMLARSKESPEGVRKEVEELKETVKALKREGEERAERVERKVESANAAIAALAEQTQNKDEEEEKKHLQQQQKHQQSEEARELKEELKQTQTEMADVQEALQILSEEVEGDRVKAKVGQKTIGTAMVDLKESVDNVRELMEVKDKEVDSMKEEVKNLKEAVKKSDESSGSIKKILLDLEKLEKRIGEGSRAERLREAKIAGQMDKISKSVQKVEAAMDERLEEDSLEMGMLKLKVGDIETNFGGVGGRIRVVEEEITVLKKKVKEVQSNAPKSAPKPAPKPAPPPPPPPLDDSFESDDNESVKIMNVKREMGSVPIKKPQPPPAAAAAAVIEEGDSFDFEGITFEVGVAIPRPIKSSDFDVVETVFSQEASSSSSLLKADDAGKAPRQGDRVKARWKGLRSWFKGVCIAVNDKNVEGGGGVITWDVQYDDGAIDKFMKRDFIMLDEEFYEGDKKAPTKEQPKKAQEPEKVEPPRSPIRRSSSTGAPGAYRRPSSAAKPDLTEIQKAEMEEEAKALEDSTKMAFPSQIFVMRWSAAQVRSWIVNVVKMQDVADKFYEQKMNGSMIMDRTWTPRDMEHDLSHPTEGMNITNAQKRARVSAFIKALRETDRETRKSRIRNYYAIWKGQDEVGNEEEEMANL
ncbi:hypothetical protein TrVE_jg5987 [Triparma verrucosa]|uniref:SAM domain-containing protein n=1 Tax=Triparma verrucosa TaxID=1606542 RepID=A0A9W7BHA8_9STRA|nr:hypothetical protein TrVE_jg5987 [Triparma verrucosa]